MKNNKKVIFSILVATKDRLSDIDSFLGSLKNCGILKRQDTEVIVINNSFKYNELSHICKRFEVTLLYEPHGGKSNALNKGIKFCRGDFLIFTDDDVVIRDCNWPDKLIANFKEKKERLGYVSGNVKAINTKFETQAMWENKGGLSKGENYRYYSISYFRKLRFTPWPINRIAVGANCMIPKFILEKVGDISPVLGPGGLIPHGESLEVVYRIIRSGYEIAYDPKAVIYHNHPISPLDLKRKLYIYGIGNSAYQLFIFMTFKDIRSLYWGLLGHHLYVFLNFLKSLIYLYPMPPSYVLHSLAGSLAGTFLFFKNYTLIRERIYAKN